MKEIYLTVEEELDQQDLFIYFAIGGSLRIDATYIRSKNAKKTVEQGDKGFYFRTELQSGVVKGEKTPFEKQIEIEVRDSLGNLEKQRVLMELWEYNSFSYNQRRGSEYFDLFPILSGHIYQNFNVLSSNR